VSTTPIIRSTQNCNYSLRYWWQFLCRYLPPTWPSLATLEGGSCTVPKAVVTVLCTPDDECGWHPKHVEWSCRIINRLFLLHLVGQLLIYFFCFVSKSAKQRTWWHCKFSLFTKRVNWLKNASFIRQVVCTVMISYYFPYFLELIRLSVTGISILIFIETILGRPHWERNVGWERMGMGCWGEYLGLRATR